MNRVRVKRVILGLAVLLVLIQLVQPKRTNPPVIESRSLMAHVQVPPQVQMILQRSCFNCHSSSTVWPWYSYVAPVSWLIADDVNQSRTHINFQDWEAQESPKEATEHLGLICEEVRNRDMPPLDYRIVHRNAQLSDEEVKTVCAWSESFISPSESEGKPKEEDGK
jgi:hypothetical protein